MKKKLKIKANWMKSANLSKSKLKEKKKESCQEKNPFETVNR